MFKVKAMQKQGIETTTSGKMVKSFRYIANILSLDTVKNSLRLQKAFRSYVITERLVEDFLLDIVFYGVS